MTLKLGMARAYVNHGRWIADCPTGCGGAQVLQPHQTLMHCQECRAMSPVDWPYNADDIWEALNERPYDRVKNWFPEDHELALMSRCPHGQTPAELREETRENVVDGT